MPRYVRTSTNNTKTTVYHTDESCRMLQRANHYREATENELGDRSLSECQYCSGEYEPTTEQTTKYQEALKQAAKQNAD